MVFPQLDVLEENNPHGTDALGEAGDLRLLQQWNIRHLSNQWLGCFLFHDGYFGFFIACPHFGHFFGLGTRGTHLLPQGTPSRLLDLHVYSRSFAIIFFIMEKMSCVARKFFQNRDVQLNIHSPKPTQPEPFEHAIALAIQKQIEKIVIEEGQAAARRVEERVRCESAQIVARVLTRFSMQRVGDELVIRVEFPKNQ